MRKKHEQWRPLWSENSDRWQRIEISGHISYRVAIVSQTTGTQILGNIRWRASAVVRLCLKSQEVDPLSPNNTSDVESSSSFRQQRSSSQADGAKQSQKRVWPRMTPGGPAPQIARTMNKPHCFAWQVCPTFLRRHPKEENVKYIPVVTEVRQKQPVMSLATQLEIFIFFKTKW